MAVLLAAGMGPPRDNESWRDWLARRARAYRDSLRTITAISQYVTGFVLQEQAHPRDAAEKPADPIAAVAGLLDGTGTALARHD